MITKLKEAFLCGFIILAALVLQNFLTFSFLRFNLAILAVYYIAVKKGFLPGIFSGVISGFFEDAMAGRILGPAILSRGLLGTMASYVSERMVVWTATIGVFLLFIITFLDETIVFLCLKAFDKNTMPMKEFATTAVITALLNAPWGIFIKKNE